MDENVEYEYKKSVNITVDLNAEVTFTVRALVKIDDHEWEFYSTNSDSIDVGSMSGDEIERFIENFEDRAIQEIRNKVEKLKEAYKVFKKRGYID